MGTRSSQEARKSKGDQVADQSTAPKPQVFEHKSRDSFDALKKQGIDRMLRDAARYDAAMLKTIERKKKARKGTRKQQQQHGHKLITRSSGTDTASRRTAYSQRVKSARDQKTKGKGRKNTEYQKKQTKTGGKHAQVKIERNRTIERRGQTAR